MGGIQRRQEPMVVVGKPVGLAAAQQPSAALAALIPVQKGGLYG